MKNLLALAGVVALAAACTASDDPVSPADMTVAGAKGGGMGDIAKYTDYKLNIIGVSHDKTADMDNNNGRRIFVQLEGGQPVCVTDADWAAYVTLLGTGDPNDNPYGCEDLTAEELEAALKGGRGKKTGGWDGLDKVNKILLTPNKTDEFGVLDANATDKDGAEFTMPDDVATEYKVYARALGTPGGKAAITLCANETDETVDGATEDIETWCSINQAVLTRDKGHQPAEDVTNELFTLTILIDVDDVKDAALVGCLDTAKLIDVGDTELQYADVPIFHQCFEHYFWNYDNNGLKLLQLWFMRTPTV